MPIKLRRTNPSTGFNEWRNLASLKLRRTNPSTGEPEWRNITKALLRTSTGWQLIFGPAGPATTTAPYFSSDSAGNNRIIEPIIYGTTFYGQRGSWDANGGTISSYTYRLDSVTSATIGEGTITNIIPETSMGSTSVPITANSSAYDGKWMIFTVKATRSDNVSGEDNTDNVETGTGYRIAVIKNKPTLTVNTTLWINGSPGITNKPAAGDAVSLVATWDTTENKSIDGTRTITKWYRSATAPVINTTSPKAASGGYYETTGATFLGSGIAYVVTSADNDSYIFANQEVFNSYTDYNYGTVEGNGIKTGAAFTQTVGAPYSFAMGNTLYSSTNGSVGFDSGHSSTNLPTSGRHLYVYGLDLKNLSTKHWSNSKDYVIQYNSGFYSNYTSAPYNLKYQVKFSTDHPDYALIKIINKGASLSTPSYIGYYDGSTQISTLAGPYSLSTGSIYKINFNGTAGTTSALSFNEVNDAAFVTDSVSPDDDTFYTLTSGTFQYTLPTIVFNTPTVGPTSLSYTVASTGNDFSFYDYTVRTGSHTGTLVTSGTNQTGTLTISGLSPTTTYYVQVIPYNSQVQNGTTVLLSNTTIANPTISGVSVSDTTPFPGSATSVVVSNSPPSNTGSVSWSNGSNTSFANLFSVSGAGSGGAGTDPTSIATSGTFSVLSTGTASVSIRAINQIKEASVSWAQTNAQSYTIEYSLSGLGAQTPVTANSSASNVSVLLYSSPTARLVTINSITVWSGPDQTGTPVTSFPTTSVTPSNKTTNTSGSGSVTYTLLPAYTPTISATTSTADGFTGQVTNYSASYNWSIATSSGSVSFTGSPNIANATYNFTVTGLAPGASAIVTITTTRVGYSDGSATASGTATTGTALTPTFGTNTSTANGFTGSVTNYNASYTWNISATTGSVVWGTASGSTRPFTVSGLNPGSSSTVTVSTSRVGYNNGSAQTTGSSTTGAALTPTFGTNSSTTSGFTGSVTNYDANYTWVIATNSGSVNWGVASGSTRPFTVSGLNPGSSATVTVSTSRTGYNNGSAQTSGTATTGAALTPTFGTNSPTTGGFFGSVTNYDANYTWGIATNSGSVNWSLPSGSTRAFTVSGLSAGASATVTVSTSRTGYNNGSAQTTGTASNPTYTITFASNGYVVGTTSTFVTSTTPNTVRTGTVGQSAAAPANPTPPSGYTFAGFWRDGTPTGYINQVNSGGSWTITATDKTFNAYYNAIVPNISSITVTGNVTAGVTCTAVMTNTQSVEYVIYGRDTTTSAWVQLAAGTASANGTSLTTTVATTSSVGTLPDQYYVTMTPYTGTRSTSGSGGGTGNVGTQRSTIGSPKSNASGSITVNY